MEIENCFFPRSHKSNDQLRFGQHADFLHKIIVHVVEFTNSMQKILRVQWVLLSDIHFLLGLVSRVAEFTKINS